MQNLPFNVGVDQNSSLQRVGSTSKWLFVVSAVCRRAYIIVAESLNMSATTSDKIWIRKLPPHGMVTI
jgi:hypothetical protein